MNNRMENFADPRLAVLDELSLQNNRVTEFLISEVSKLERHRDLNRRANEVTATFDDTVKYLGHAHQFHRFKEFMAGGKEQYAQEIRNHARFLADQLFHLNEQAKLERNNLRERIASACTNEANPVPQTESDAAIAKFKKNLELQTAAAPVLCAAEAIAAVILDPSKNTEEHRKQVCDSLQQAKDFLHKKDKLHQIQDGAKEKLHHFKDKVHHLFHHKKDKQPGEPAPAPTSAPGSALK